MVVVEVVVVGSSARVREDRRWRVGLRRASDAAAVAQRRDSVREVMRCVKAEGLEDVDAGAGEGDMAGLDVLGPGVGDVPPPSLPPPPPSRQ